MKHQIFQKVIELKAKHHIDPNNRHSLTKTILNQLSEPLGFLNGQESLILLDTTYH